MSQEEQRSKRLIKKLQDLVGYQARILASREMIIEDLIKIIKQGGNENGDALRSTSTSEESNTTTTEPTAAATATTDATTTDAE